MKVLCINDDFTEQRRWANWHRVEEYPRKGAVYTVGKKIKYPDGYGLIIRELTNKNFRISFHSNRFVPVSAISKALKAQIERRNTCSQI